MIASASDLVSLLNLRADAMHVYAKEATPRSLKQVMNRTTTSSLSIFHTVQRTAEHAVGIIIRSTENGRVLKFILCFSLSFSLFLFFSL